MARKLIARSGYHVQIFGSMPALGRSISKSEDTFCREKYHQHELAFVCQILSISQTQTSIGPSKLLNSELFIGQLLTCI